MTDDDDYDDGCLCGSEECAECGTECTHCGGDPLVECDDPIQCCTPHLSGWCQCRACNGTGLRAHQWIF